MLIQLNLIKKDHIVYPGGELVSVNTENIKYLFNGPDPGTVDILYYDEQSAKLSHMITNPYTVSIFGLAGFLSQPMSAYVRQIDASNVNKPGVLNRANSTYEVTTAGITNVFYNNGRWNSQRNKRIKVGYYASVSTLTGPQGITAVNQSLKRFSVGINLGTAITAGDVIFVEGSTGNDGLYTVVSVTAGATSLIFVKEPIVDATVDGDIYYS